MHQCLRLRFGQRQRLRVGHEHLVHADLPVTRRHPSPGLRRDSPLPGNLQSRPGQGLRLRIPAQHISHGTFMGHAQRGLGVLQPLPIELHEAQQFLKPWPWQGVAIV